jgi:beta-glucosidase
VREKIVLSFIRGSADAGKKLAALAAACFASAGLVCSQPPQKPGCITGNPRVDKLLSQMTLDEKISMLHGAQEPQSTYQGQGGFLPGIPRLRISSMRFSDGPPGILTRVPAMAYTATMGLAATFSTADARQNGLAIAREARSHGIDVVLEPFINIDRDVTFRRGYNTFGEDPLLTGAIGASEISAIQSLGIMAQAKHFIAFDSSGSSYISTYNVNVEPQAMHELYVPPFEDAVRAGVSSIMCSYNEVDGAFACGNRDTLVGILRDELHFNGFVTSDWGATHAVDFINNGLDLEMGGTIEIGRPRETYFTQVKEAVLSGQVSGATIDRAVGHILVEMDRFGLLNGRPERAVSRSPVEENAPVVQKTSEDAAVLLKNEDGVLPLKKSDLASLVLIGPGAGQTIAVGQPGEKSVGLPAREIGTVAALRKDTAGTPGVKIRYAVADNLTGLPVPAQYLSHNGQPGLERITADGRRQTDPQVDFTSASGMALPAEFSGNWEGVLTAPSAGRYALHMEILGAYGKLMLDGKPIAHIGRMWVHGDVTQAGESSVLPTTDGLDNVTAKTELTAGAHQLSLSVSPDSSHHPSRFA